MAEYKSKHTGADIDAGIDAALAALPKSGGTMTGDLILLGSPTTDNSAVNRKYVDESIENILLTPGADGKSAYEIAKEKGFEGTEEEWLASLEGEQGPQGEKGETGEDGAAGKDGTSVTVKGVSESTADGGENIVTFSDGNTLAVRNGSKGSTGAKGTSVTVAEVGISNADDGINTVIFSDGKTLQIKNGSKGSKGEQGTAGADGAKGDKGDPGADGQRGTGILNTTTGIAAYTTAVGGVTPAYRISLSTLKTQAKVSEVLVGDIVRYSYYLYPVIYLDSSYAYLGTRSSIRGATGAEGAAGPAGADGKDGYFTATQSEFDALSQEDVAAKYADGVRLLIIDPDTNLVPKSISESGVIYNGCGYMMDRRLTSSGGTSAADAAVLTGYIPYTYGNVIEIAGGGNPANAGGQYIATYDSNFALIGVNYLDALISNSGGSTVCTIDNDHVHTVKTANFSASSNSNMFKTAAYIRVSLAPCLGNKLRVRYV